MTVTDEKGVDAFEVYCPQPLREYLGGVQKRRKPILPKNLSEAMSYDSAEKRFRAWRKELGPEAAPFVLHGLRKLAIVRLAEAGCSDAQIQAITNQSAEMVPYYRKRASRVVLSRAAHTMVEQNKNRRCKWEHDCEQFKCSCNRPKKLTEIIV